MHKDVKRILDEIVYFSIKVAMSAFKHFIYALVIAAFTLSGISPACDFISGNKNFIEICAADGSLKTIALSNNGKLLDQSEESEHHSSTKNDCSFCFAQTHSKGLSLTTSNFTTVFERLTNLQGSLSSYIQNTSLYRDHAPRAPPQLFLS